MPTTQKRSLAAEASYIADKNFHSTLLRANGDAFLVSLTSGIDVGRLGARSSSAGPSSVGARERFCFV